MSAVRQSRAERAYGALVAALARGEDRPLAEVLTVAAAAGKTVDDVADDVAAAVVNTPE